MWARRRVWRSTTTTLIVRLARLVMSLRRQGLHARSSSKATRNVGKLLGDAGKNRARMAVILGAELAEGSVALKDLDAGTQQVVPLATVVAAIKAARGS